MMLDHFSEFLQTSSGSFPLYIGCFGVTSFDNSFAESILKEIKLTKETRLDEVEQAPQLREIVLHRGTW